MIGIIIIIITMIIIGFGLDCDKTGVKRSRLLLNSD